MEPAQPPLPTPSYLPFQPEVGSQTSILISESLGRFQSSCDAAELGEILKRGVVALGEFEPAGRDDLGGGDSGAGKR